MTKTNSFELANVSTAGSASATWQLSTLVPMAQEAKPNYKETVVVCHLSALSGTSPTMQFDVYELFDNAWIHVGTTGSMSSPDDRVIDSGGGMTSSGATFSSGSNTGTLRLLGKGSDLKVVGSTTGTIGTIAFTVALALYDA
jgi:hypothetical protein